MFPWAGCALTAPFHPYPAKSGAVSLCCTCPGVTPGGRYPLSLPCGARTFLIWVLSVPIRGCPPRSRIYCTSWGGKSQMSCKFFSERIYYIICLPVQLSITYTNWEFVEVSARPEQHCHSEPVRLSGVGISIEFWAAHRHTVCSFCTVSRNSSTRSGTSNQGIATPVCELARNDREFDKFQFVY